MTGASIKPKVEDAALVDGTVGPGDTSAAATVPPISPPTFSKFDLSVLDSEGSLVTMVATFATATGSFERETFTPSSDPRLSTSDADAFTFAAVSASGTEIVTSRLVPLAAKSLWVLKRRPSLLSKLISLSCTLLAFAIAALMLLKGMDSETGSPYLTRISKDFKTAVTADAPVCF